MKIRNKITEKEAFRFRVDGYPDWFADRVTDLSIITHEKYCDIQTLEGIMRAVSGDWIIKGVEGEIYPCKPSVFEKSYEVIE